MPAIELNWDESGDWSLDGEKDSLSYEQSQIANHPGEQAPGHHIRVFVLGTAPPDPADKGKGYLGRSAWGVAPFDEDGRSFNLCFLMGTELAEGWSVQDVIRVCAHEIGHVLVGPGHPDHGGGRAPLAGSDRTVLRNRQLS